jgi:hypothetical protein
MGAKPDNGQKIRSEWQFKISRARCVTQLVPRLEARRRDLDAAAIDCGGGIRG